MRIGFHTLKNVLCLRVLWLLLLSSSTHYYRAHLRSYGQGSRQENKMVSFTLVRLSNHAVYSGALHIRRKQENNWRKLTQSPVCFEINCFSIRKRFQVLPDKVITTVFLYDVYSSRREPSRELLKIEMLPRKWNKPTSQDATS